MKRFWFVVVVVASLLVTSSGAAQSALPGYDQVGDIAKAQVGKPVVLGAAGPNAFDGPGLVWWSYKQAGIAFPRTVRSQYAATEPVDADHRKKGDLIFYGNRSRVAVYFGDGTMIGAGDNTVIRTAVPVNGEARTYLG